MTPNNQNDPDSFIKIKAPKRQRPMKNFKIFKVRMSMYGSPTGLIITATSQRKAENEARKTLGRGTYWAYPI